MDAAKPKPPAEISETCGDDCQCANAHDAGEDSHCGCSGCGHRDEDDEGDAGYDPEDESWRSDRAPVVDEPAPEMIDELAGACVRFVRDTIGVELDFTAETLPLLDHYLTLARDELNEKLELRELVWRSAGAYFGEVLRRQLNGFWQIPTEDVHTWRVCGRHVMMSVNPVGVIVEAIAGSTDTDGPSGVLRLARPDEEDVSRRLAEMPPLPENEFFLTSTRLEVIDVVVEHLRMRMSQNDQSDMEFDLEDYASDLQAYGRA